MNNLGAEIRITVVTALSAVLLLFRIKFRIFFIAKLQVQVVTRSIYRDLYNVAWFY